MPYLSPVCGLFRPDIPWLTAVPIDESSHVTAEGQSPRSRAEIHPVEIRGGLIVDGEPSVGAILRYGTKWRIGRVSLWNMFWVAEPLSQQRSSRLPASALLAGLFGSRALPSCSATCLPPRVHGGDQLAGDADLGETRAAVLVRIRCDWGVIRRPASPAWHRQATRRSAPPSCANLAAGPTRRPTDTRDTRDLCAGALRWPGPSRHTHIHYPAIKKPSDQGLRAQREGPGTRTRSLDATRFLRRATPQPT